MAPSQEYVSRLAARELRVADHEKTHIRLGNTRLVLAILTLLVGWLALGRHTLSPWWLAAPIAAFIGIAAYHARVLRDRDLAQRAVTFYKNGIARMEDRWSGIGETGVRFDDPHHVYASDLDLFGDGSLFQLVSTARTRIGEEALAAWLLSPAPVDQVLPRQASVTELRVELDLREDLAVLGEDAGVGVHPDDLVKWAEAPNQLQSSWIPRVAPVLAVLATFAAFAWGYWGIATPFLVLVVVEGLLKYRVRKPMESVLDETEHAFHDLDLLSGVLARVEAHTFHSEPLAVAAAATVFQRSIQFPGYRQVTHHRRSHQLAPQYVSESHRRTADVLRPGGVRCRALAACSRQIGASLAGCGGRDRSAALAGGLQLRTSRRSVSRIQRRAGIVHGRANWPSPHSGSDLRS